jgi:hypothetical protein
MKGAKNAALPQGILIRTVSGKAMTPMTENGTQA